MMPVGQPQVTVVSQQQPQPIAQPPAYQRKFYYYTYVQVYLTFRVLTFL